MEAVRASTGGNAGLHGKEDMFGTTDAGTTADMVIPGSNLLEDIRNTRGIKWR